MRLLLQRVRRAAVTVDGRLTGAIGPGLLAFAGFAARDDDATLALMARRLVELRIFADEAGRMNRSLAEAGGGLLVVSQFTLYADCRKGRRPSYTGAAPPAEARELYDRFVAACRELCGEVATGEFAAMMDVELVNDGPVTIWLDSEELPRPAR